MNIFKIGILALGLCTATACSDSFLDVEPRGSVTDENFYKTPEDAYRALVGCYDGLQTVWVGGVSFPLASEIMSDNCFGGTGNSDRYGYQMIDQFDKSVSPSDLNLYENNWTAYYKAVYRCNVLISKMDQIEWGNNEGLRKIYESEARFLRAYLYFDMVRLWGNIPLLTEPTTENVPQATPDEVYKVIAEDLKLAAENLEGTAYASQASATYGRVTKWAAQALLARVYLFYTGYYGKSDLVGLVSQSDALAHLEDLIANGGFSLLENFASLWPAASLEAYAGEHNPEIVFSIKYTYTSDYNGNSDGNHWMVMYGIREQALFPYGNGWGGGTVTPDIWNAYNEDDSRRAASIISIEEEELDFKNEAKQREYTGYYVKKYTPMVDEEGNSIPVVNGGTNFMIGQFQDYFSIRYADVLLMAAELGSANAQSYFDAVRERAYKAKFTSLPVNQQNIQKERRLELAFEGHRYWDLLRQGVSVAAEAIATEETVLNGGVAGTVSIEASNIVNTQGLQQIPYTQITLSDNQLKQNPGW